MFDDPIQNVSQFDGIGLSVTTPEGSYRHGVSTDDQYSLPPALLTINEPLLFKH